MDTPSNPASHNPYRAPTATVDDINDGSTELADRLTRLGAVIIDGLIQSVVFLVVFLPFIMIYGWDAIVGWGAGHLILWTLICLILGIAIFFGLNFRLLRDNGQTIGKRFCKIKIVRTDGSPADIQRLVLFRYLPVLAVPQIPYIGGLYAIVDMLLIFRESRQCLHDTIADTIVIKA